MILIFAGLIIVIVIVFIYNGLIRKKNEVDNAFGGIDVQLKKRYDIIPNLVATVQQYALHEKELLKKVTQLRARANSGTLLANEKVSIDNQISKALNGIMVSVENYPELKANENFLNLQRTLNEIESQISAARRSYNAVVAGFNTGIETFPGNMLAGIMGLRRKTVFEVPKTEMQNINVKNLLNPE